MIIKQQRNEEASSQEKRPVAKKRGHLPKKRGNAIPKKEATPKKQTKDKKKTTDNP